jgi:hypothetical protein
VKNISRPLSVVGVKLAAGTERAVPVATNFDPNRMLTTVAFVTSAPEPLSFAQAAGRDAANQRN